MSSRRRTSAVHGALLALLVVVFAAPALRSGFVFDDTQMIVQGRVIHDARRAPEVFRHSTMWVSDEGSTTSGSQTYRPVTLLTFFADAAVWGREPFGYHLTSLLLHVLCVLLVRSLCARALGEGASPWMATIAAAWFALSPLLAEAYVWINGRSDPMALAFALGGWLAWLRARERAGGARPRDVVLPAVLWLLGLLSKEALVLALPVFALWPGLVRRERVQVAVAVGFAVATYLALRTLALHGLATHSDTRQLGRAVTRLALLWLDGLVSLFVPNRVYLRLMADEYESLGIGAAIAAWALVVVIAAALLVKGRRLPWVRWALLFHAASLAPVALITSLSWPGFGRYLYIPAAGFAVALATTLDAAQRKLATGPARSRRLALGAVALYLVALGARLTLWSFAWHDEPALYRQAIDDAPDRAGGYAWLGEYLLEHDRAGEALPLLLQADERWQGDRHVLERAGRAAIAVNDPVTAWRIAQRGMARYHPSGPFDLVGAWARRNDPAIAADLLARCLGEGEEATPCVRAAESVVRSARAREYVEAFSQWCTAHPGDRAVPRIAAITSRATPAPAAPRTVGAPSPP